MRAMRAESFTGYGALKLVVASGGPAARALPPRAADPL